MFKKAGSGRDAFTFSLKGLTTIASFTLAPAIASDRFAGPRVEPRDQNRATASHAVRRIEEFLGSYFAPGCCGPAGG